MTEDPTTPDTVPGSPIPPLAPKPGQLAVALLLVILLFANLYADARTGGSYDGKYLTFAVIGLIAGVLGVDVTKIFRGGGPK